MERYRGTEYDQGGWDAAANTVTLTPPMTKSAKRLRTIVIVAFVAVVGLYGTMLVYSDFESNQDQPAAVVSSHR